MERGVQVGGLMVFGSFLLATLLNRSALEEIPAAPSTPVAVGAPIHPSAVSSEAPSASGCTAAEAKLDSKVPPTPTQPAAPDCSD